MATDPTVPYKYLPAGPASAPQTQINFDTFLKYITDRNNGSSSWDALVVIGNASIGGTLLVTGATTLTGDTTILGDLQVGSTSPANEAVRKITVTWDKNNSGTNNVGGLELHNNDQSSAGRGYRMTVDGDGRLVFVDLGNTPWTGTTNIMTSTAAGEWLRPLQPSFLVTDGTGASNVTGDATVYTELWPTEIFDQGSDFGTNAFTAPVTGRYFLSASVQLENVLVSHTIVSISIVTSNRTYTRSTNMLIDRPVWGISLNALTDMDAGDTATVAVQASGSTKTVDITASAAVNYFSGSLIN